MCHNTGAWYVLRVDRKRLQPRDRPISNAVACGIPPRCLAGGNPPAPYPPDAGAAQAEPHGDAAPRIREWTRPALQAGRVAAYRGGAT